MISPNPNIRKLNLSHKDLTEIPDEVYRLKQLRVLDLSYNLHSRQLPNELNINC